MSLETLVTVLAQFPARMTTTVAALGEQTGQALLAAAIDAAPKHTGHSASELRVETATSGNASHSRTLGPKTLQIVITGQREHDIVARNAKALFWEGAAHPVKKVHHPAVPPSDWRQPAARALAGKLRALGLEAIQTSLSDIRGASQ